MNNVSIMSAEQKLAWAKVMPNTALCELKMPGKKLVIKDSAGLFRAVRPEGELVIISMRDGRITEEPWVVYGEQDEALLNRHFSWVLPGQEHILCMLWHMLGVIKIPELRSFYFAVLSDDELMELIWLSLRQSKGLRFEDLRALGIDNPESRSAACVNKWIRKDFVINKNGILHLKGRGWIFMDEIVTDLANTYSNLE